MNPLEGGHSVKPDKLSSKELVIVPKRKRFVINTFDTRFSVGPLSGLSPSDSDQKLRSIIFDLNEDASVDLQVVGYEGMVVKDARPHIRRLKSSDETTIFTDLQNSQCPTEVVCWSR